MRLSACYCLDRILGRSVLASNACKYHWPALKTPPSAMQGDLGDPLYFDFIAFSQFAAISEAMESGRQEFEVRP